MIYHPDQFTDQKNSLQVKDKFFLMVLGQGALLKKLSKVSLNKANLFIYYFFG